MPYHYAIIIEFAGTEITEGEKRTITKLLREIIAEQAQPEPRGRPIPKLVKVRWWEKTGERIPTFLG